VNEMGIGQKKGKAAGTVLETAKKDEGMTAFKRAKLRAMNQRKELFEQQSGFMLCGISGDPGTGKTGLQLIVEQKKKKIHIGYLFLILMKVLNLHGGNIGQVMIRCLFTILMCTKKI